MKRRVLSALLALCLMLSLMPEAWASGGTADPPTSGDCGTGVKWIFTESTGGLLIYGSGEMSDFADVASVPWAAHREKITTVDINSSVASIGNNAFTGCINLASLTIPNSVTKIGTDAFTGSGLKSISYSGSDEDWNKIAGLDNIPSNVAINKSDQESATSGTCGPGVTWMLTEDTASNTVTLTILGKGPIVIEDGRAPWAASRDKITDVIISDDVTAIGGGAFAAFPNLKTVLIPDSVTTIEGGAFAGITNGTTVRYTGDEKQWNDIGGNGKNDIASAGITPVYNYRPIVLTFTRGEATVGTSFQRTTVKGSVFLLPSETDPDFDFEPPEYIPPGSTTTDPKKFRGWLLTVDGKEMVYPEGYPVKVDSNTTFTAWWDEPSTGTNNKITFRHKFNDDPQLFEEPKLPEVDYEVSKKDQVLMVGNPAKDGYDFLGWTTLQDRNTLLPNIVVPGGRSGTLIYIANWKGKSFKVMVQEEGGADFSVTEYVVSPVEQKLTVKVPVADGMTWEISGVVSSGTVTYENAIPDSPGEATIIIPADVSGDIVVQGKFKSNHYDITWDANGGAWGSGDAKETTKTKKDAYEFDKENDNTTNGNPDANPDRRGYELNGWVCEDPKVTTKRGEDGSITVTIGKGTFGDLTLKADWKLKDYTVTWNAGEGAWGTGDTAEKNQKTKYNVESDSLTIETHPTREGWTFAGWKGEARKKDSTTGEKIELKSSEENLNTVPLNPEEIELEDITLTAQWKQNFTVTLDPNNAVEGKDPQEPLTFTVVDGDEYTLPTIEETEFTPPDASKQFTGWQLVGDTDPDHRYQPGDKVKITGNTTFKAVWGDVTYDVIVIDGGDKTVTEPVIHGTDYELKEYTAYSFTAPDGKAFDYWQVDAFPGRKFNPGDKLRQVQQDYTVTAVWKDILYTVTFEKGDENAEGTMASVENLTYGTEYILPKCRFTYLTPEPDPDNPDAVLPKMVFLAWSVDGTEYAEGAVITITKDTTVTAVWEDEANLDTYTVTYAPGGGTGTMEPDTFRVRKGTGSSVTVPLPTTCDGFTFEDMTFAGWTVGNDKCAPGASIIISSSVQATARWKGRIVYEDGGGVTKPDSYEYTPGAYDPRTIEGTPVKPGSIFKGWTCEDTRVAIFNNSLIDLPAGFSGTLTLTGEWDENENVYLVTYDPNGGTGPQKEVEVEKKPDGEATTHILLNYEDSTFTPPAGMEFDCWTVEEKDYKPGDSITLTGPVTVKAKWKDQAVDPDAPDQTVTFDPGEGSGTMEAVTVKKGQWYDLPECAFEAPEGKEFDCWSIDGVRQEESRILIEGDVTLTALWKDKEPEPEDPNKPWTITFDAGGGTGTMSPVTVPKAEGGATYTLPACAFTAPEGKTFQAWQFDGQEYAPGAVITITGDTTITAVWKDAEVKPPKPTSWKITYNLNGGYMTGSGPTSYNLSDQAQTLNVPVPYKSGYTFLGWTYSGVSKPTKSVIIRANMTGDLTVVANWQMNPGAGGSNNTNQGYYISVSATAGGEIIIPWEYASQGVTVSVQARPQPGYEVGGVTVVNSQGFEVGDLRDLGGGSYSFTMPGYRVNVSATFKLQSAAAGPISRPVMNYEDVRLGDWYYDSVEYVYNRGMMSGVSATQFGPNGQATRGAIWTALAAHAGFDINGGATWYERGQYWAVNRGITDGESPSGNITREQLVTMLWRYKGSPVVFGGDLWQFSDGYAVSPYAMDAMRWAVSTGLIGGANGRLNPQASTTRAEAATILARFCQS